MHGQWPYFAKIQAPHRRPPWLNDLITALTNYLSRRPVGEFPWIERLAHSLVEPLRSQQKRRNAPLSLRDIVGNCTVIERIAKRYLIDGIRKPLILSGPVGSASSLLRERLRAKLHLRDAISEWNAM